MAEIQNKMIEKIGGWGNVFTYSLMITVLVYVLIKHHNLTRNAAYVKGYSLGVKRGVHGNYNLYYTFKVGGIQYHGSYKNEICNKCNCCDSGSVVVVRIENGKPSNNDVVEKLPDGAWFLDY